MQPLEQLIALALPTVVVSSLSTGLIPGQFVVFTDKVISAIHKTVRGPPDFEDITPDDYEVAVDLANLVPKCRYSFGGAGPELRFDIFYFLRLFDSRVGVATETNSFSAKAVPPVGQGIKSLIVKRLAYEISIVVQLLISRKITEVKVMLDFLKKVMKSWGNCLFGEILL